MGRLPPESGEDALTIRFVTDDCAYAAFVEVAIERLELWIRGVTPEPFGMKTTVVERDGDGWRAG
jgi:hypothetical protein